MSEEVSGFFVAPFRIDGELEGLAYQEVSRLSRAWHDTCAQFLELHGSHFDRSWSGNLSHIRTKFTARSGVAIVTFSVDAKIAASIALESGLSPFVEADVMKLFVDSLGRVGLVRTASASAQPFESVLSIKDRPLMIVVPWPDSTITTQDHALVRELAVHLAGAFFARSISSA